MYSLDIVYIYFSGPLQALLSQHDFINRTRFYLQNQASRLVLADAHIMYDVTQVCFIDSIHRYSVKYHDMLEDIGGLSEINHKCNTYEAPLTTIRQSGCFCLLHVLQV